MILYWYGKMYMILVELWGDCSIYSLSYWFNKLMGFIVLRNLLSCWVFCKDVIVEFVIVKMFKIIVVWDVFCVVILYLR